MNRIDPSLNPLEVMLVCEDLERRGRTMYNLVPGNQCIWAQCHQLNLYYIFRDSKIVDIQID